MYYVIGRWNSLPKMTEEQIPEFIQHRRNTSKVRFNQRFLCDITHEEWVSYPWASEHLILRENENSTRDDNKNLELIDIINNYTKQWYTILINSKQNQSIPIRYHVHFLKLKPMLETFNPLPYLNEILICHKNT
jgi:hypothetical protein